jgi:hypothetical protein
VLGGDTHDPLHAPPGAPELVRTPREEPLEPDSVVTTQCLLIGSPSLRYVRKQPHGRKTAPPDDPPRDGRAARPKLADRVYTRAQLAKLPQPEPLIDNTLDRRTVAAIAGPPGSLKSFVALSWGCSIATGTLWLGRGARRDRTLIVAAEGAHGIDQRITAWEDRHITVPDDKLTVVSGPVNLLKEDEVRELLELASGYTLVVIDTLASSMVGGNDNDPGDMGRVVDVSYRIRDVTAAGTVVLVHHVPKAGGTLRGSSHLEGGVDTIYLADGNWREMTLTRTKRKDGPLDDVLSLQLELHKSSGTVADRLAQLTNAADQPLSAYRSAFSDTGCTKRKLRIVADMAPATFHRSLNSLLSLGILINTGSDKRPFYRRPDGAV